MRIGSRLSAEALLAEWPFLFSTLLFGLVVVFLVPPFQVNDEKVHFARVLQLLQGQVVAAPNSVVLPESTAHFVTDFHARKATVKAYVARTRLFPDRAYTFGEAFSARYEAHPGEEAIPVPTVGNARLYPPIAYTGQLIGTGVASWFTHSTPFLFYAGRTGGLLAAFVVLAIAVRLMPGWKGASEFLLLTPMMVITRSSFSADGMSTSLAFLAIALICHYAWGNLLRVRRRHIALLAVVLTAAALCKPPILALALFYFAIPEGKFSSPYARAGGFLAIVLCAVGIVAAWWMYAVPPDLAASLGTKGGAGGMLGEAGNFLRLTFHTLRAMAGEWYPQFVGSYFTTSTFFSANDLFALTLYLPPYALAFYAFALLVVLWIDPSPPGVMGWQRGLAALTFVGFFFALAALFYVSYAQDAIIPGIQGRYFHPAALLLAVAFPWSNRWTISLPSYARSWLATALGAAMVVCSLSYIYLLSYASLAR